MFFAGLSLPHEPWNARSNTKQDAFNKEVNVRSGEFLVEVLCPRMKAELSAELGREADI